MHPRDAHTILGHPPEAKHAGERGGLAVVQSLVRARRWERLVKQRQESWHDEVAKLEEAGGEHHQRAAKAKA
jgi:hypothetical protein